jgi:hypothetical protein
MDKLEEEIQKIQREAADLKRRAEAKELELRALQKATELRPRAQSSQDPDLTTDDPDADLFELPSEKRGGRQPGAISRKWRGILNDIYANEPVTTEMVVLLASGHGLDLQEGSALSRMNRYIEFGYIEPFGKDQYRVTETAVRRFDLTRGPRKGS